MPRPSLVSRDPGLPWRALLMIAGVLLAALPALAARPTGWDSSHWEGNITPAQWATLYSNGVVFCYTKGTDGVTWTDNTMVDNMTNGKAAGVYMGVFHFSHPDLYSATAEANYFVAHAGQYVTPGYLRPVLDLEAGSNLGATALSNWVNAWINAVKQQTGVEALVYTNTNFATHYLNSTVANRDLWIAQYITNADPQNDIPSIGVFNNWRFWQYSDRGYVPGVGYKDVDVFNGTMGELQTFLIASSTQPPAITQQPSSQTVAPGSPASFTVVASGGGTLSYQWQKNQVDLTNGGHYSGVTTSTLSISNTDSNDAAGYRCIVTSTYGTATSNTASLTIQSGLVLLSDTFDTYADQTALQNTWIVNGSSLALSTGAFHSSPKSLLSVADATGRQNKRSINEIIATDANPLTLTFWMYDSGGVGTGNQWVELRDYSPATRQLVEVGIFTGNSTTYYSARVTYTPGNNWATMNQNGAPPRSAGWHQFKVVIKSTVIDFYVDNILASPARSYASTPGDVSFEEVRIGSGYASAGAAAYYDDILLQSGNSSGAPTITQQPTAAAICPGTATTFSVTASGSGTLSYQWQKNQTNLANGGHYAGVTTSTLTVSSADANDVANYRCVVSNGGGSTHSNDAALTLKSVSISQHPAAQTVASGGTTTFTVAAGGDAPFTYQWQKNQVNLANAGHVAGATTATLTISSADSSDAANYRCVVTNSCSVSATSNAAALTIGSPVSVFMVESRLGGLNYARYSETAGWSDAACKSTASGTTAGIGSRYCTMGATAVSATYEFTPTTTGSYAVYTTNCSTTNSGNPLIHKVAHAGGTATVGVCQNTTCPSNAANVWYGLGTFTLNSGTPYTVVLDGSTGAGSQLSGYAGRSDSVKWELVSAAVVAPTITQHPAVASACSNGVATFSVTATGEGTLSYQWQKNGNSLSNGGHYGGVTTPTLTVSSVGAADVAAYRCVVSNTGGGTNSNAANLFLKSATAISQNPADRTVGGGGTTTFTVIATGDGTLTYQWQKDLADLSDSGHYSGVNTGTLTITAADSGDVAGYRCLVSGGCGSINSSSANLTLRAPGDFDLDTDVDASDFGVLQACLAIANPAQDPVCQAADFNADDHVDQLDVTLFVGCLSGPDIAADPNCAAP